MVDTTDAGHPIRELHRERLEENRSYYEGDIGGLPNTAIPYEKMANTEIPRRTSTKYRYRIF